MHLAANWMEVETEVEGLKMKGNIELVMNNDGANILNPVFVHHPELKANDVNNVVKSVKSFVMQSNKLLHNPCITNNF